MANEGLAKLEGFLKKHTKPQVDAGYKKQTANGQSGGCPWCVPLAIGVALTYAGNRINKRHKKLALRDARKKRARERAEEDEIERLEALQARREASQNKEQDGNGLSTGYGLNDNVLRYNHVQSSVKKSGPSPVWIDGEIERLVGMPNSSY